MNVEHLCTRIVFFCGFCVCTSSCFAPYRLTPMTPICPAPIHPDTPKFRGVQEWTCLLTIEWHSSLACQQHEDI
jgi:hypothetical protein